MGDGKYAAGLVLFLLCLPETTDRLGSGLGFSLPFCKVSSGASAQVTAVLASIDR